MEYIKLFIICCFIMTTDLNFVEEINELNTFPISLKCHCLEGVKKLGEQYIYLGYEIQYAYDPKGRGHVWLLVRDKFNKWLAVDSYYGPILYDPYFYNPYYNLNTFEELDRTILRIKV